MLSPSFWRPLNGPAANRELLSPGCKRPLNGPDIDAVANLELGCALQAARAAHAQKLARTSPCPPAATCSLPVASPVHVAAEILKKAEAEWNPSSPPAAPPPAATCSLPVASPVHVATEILKKVKKAEAEWNPSSPPAAPPTSTPTDALRAAVAGLLELAKTDPVRPAPGVKPDPQGVLQFRGSPRPSYLQTGGADGLGQALQAALLAPTRRVSLGELSAIDDEDLGPRAATPPVPTTSKAPSPAGRGPTPIRPNLRGPLQYRTPTPPCVGRIAAPKSLAKTYAPKTPVWDPGAGLSPRNRASRTASPSPARAGAMLPPPSPMPLAASPTTAAPALSPWHCQANHILSPVALTSKPPLPLALSYPLPVTPNSAGLPPCLPAPEPTRFSPSFDRAGRAKSPFPFRRGPTPAPSPLAGESRSVHTTLDKHG